jgi:hypothetical protein
MNILKLIGIGLLIGIVSYGMGYFFAPDKVRIEEKIVEKVVHEKDTKVTKEYDPNTGKLTKEIEESKDKLTNIDSKDKTVEKSKSQKTYAVKVGAVVNPRNLNAKIIPRIGLEIAVPFFDLFLGTETDISTNPTVGLYLREAF